MHHMKQIDGLIFVVVRTLKVYDRGVIVYTKNLECNYQLPIIDVGFPKVKSWVLVERFE